MQFSSSTAAIILAAGSSSRMGEGRYKLLLPLGDRPVLAHVLDAVLASQARKPIILVLGHQAEEVRSRLAAYLANQDIIVVENLAYRQGMSTSMRAGLHALIDKEQQTPEPFADSTLMILGDQPLMTTHILDTLIATRQATSKLIVAPLYHGKRGNPILFSASLFPELLTVTGDEGGRSVIERHRQDSATVELGASMANYDVDTWEAYQQILAAWQQKHLR